MYYISRILRKPETACTQ